MDTLIVAAAKYLLFGVLLGAATAWLSLPRHEKAKLALTGVGALVLTIALIWLAAALHYDARPFVVDPGIKPLFAHVADNGFPSDHTAIAATVSLLVMARRRVLGVVLLAASVLIGVARVAAHVHHVQDIVASIVIAVLAVALSLLALRWVEPRLPSRLARLVRT